MSDTIVIERNVPVPPVKRKTDSPRPNKYSATLRLLLEEPIGSSAFFPGAKTQYVCDAGRNIGFKRDTLAYRTVDGGVRVWRIA